jgi:hypothetical protein
MAPGSRYFNFIGNILGTGGYHTTFKSIGGGDDTTVIMTGYFPGTGGTDKLSTSTSMFWGNWDNVSNAVRWCGNSSSTGWSTTCSSASEVPTGLSSYANAVPSTQTLPASFYLSSKPAWWTAGKAWPPIGPDVTGGTVGQCTGGSASASSCSADSQCVGGGSCSIVAGGRVASTPAMDCYFSVMGGTANGTGPALAFDASTCYSSSSIGAPSPPSSLSAVVK